MDVQTITMNKNAAAAEFAKYKAAVQERSDAETKAIIAGYKQLSKGRVVLNLAAVMRQAGLDHLSRPRLAICRADAKDCFCRVSNNGRAEFTMDDWPRWNATRRIIILPAGTFSTGKNRHEQWKARGPYIPPYLRPKAALSNYHVLWEADWERVPRDPMLLKRLGGMLFAVLATWELTDLEAAVLNNGF